MKSLPALLLAGCLALSAHARVLTQTVAYEHNGVKLQGYMAYDEKIALENKKVPGVLIVPEWWGLNDYVKGRAELLAKELHVVAFVADMYGDGIVTTDAKKAGALAEPFYGKPLMAERAQAGLDALLRNEHVDPAHVAAMGYCFGGSTVQALAYTGAPLAGIVSFHGGLLPVPAEAAEKTQAKILICHGAVDPFVPKADVDAFLSSMNAGKFDYQFNSYAGAVHAFTNPNADKAAADNGLVGKIGYNRTADRRSWINARTFLVEVLFPSKHPERAP